MQAYQLNRGVEILLVEDSFDDAEFVQLTLQAAKVLNRVHHVENGKEAINFLKCPTQAYPDLILLDLSMHAMDGLEFLQVVKRDESLQSIPVIVLSTSDRETDIHSAYQHYANCYLHKPVECDALVQVLIQFQNMWLQIAELPSIDLSSLTLEATL